MNPIYTLDETALYVCDGEIIRGDSELYDLITTTCEPQAIYYSIEQVQRWGIDSPVIDPDLEFDSEDAAWSYIGTQIAESIDRAVEDGDPRPASEIMNEDELIKLGKNFDLIPSDVYQVERFVLVSERCGGGGRYVYDQFEADSEDDVKALVCDEWTNRYQIYTLENEIESLADSEMYHELQAILDQLTENELLNVCADIRIKLAQAKVAK